MEARYKFAAGLLAITVAAPATIYAMQAPARDPFGDKLRSYGFAPLSPPSTLVGVGSLYYVSEDGRHYKAICQAEQADIEGVMHKSKSWRIQEDLNQTGSFATEISVRLPALLNGGASNGFAQKVHFSLTDVTIEEIPLEANFEIGTKMMNRARCAAAVNALLNSGGYVCQGQQVLLATAEFKLDRDTENKIKIAADEARDQVKDAVKSAIVSQSDQSVVEKNGQLYSGADLNFGVEVNPTCLAPPHAYFQRALPRSRWDRFANFVRFRIVEPFMPATPDQPAPVAEAQK